MARLRRSRLFCQCCRVRLGLGCGSRPASQRRFSGLVVDLKCLQTIYPPNLQTFLGVDSSGFWFGYGFYLQGSTSSPNYVFGIILRVDSPFLSRTSCFPRVWAVFLKEGCLERMEKVPPEHDYLDPQTSSYSWRLP